jgi:hypothetical protein
VTPLEDIWDAAPPPRGEDVWLSLMTQLAASLSDAAGVQLQPGPLFTALHEPCSGISLAVTGHIHGPLGVALQGQISVTINHGENVQISADLLLFADGRRVRIHGPTSSAGELYVFVAHRSDARTTWEPLGFVDDEWGEYEAVMSAADE